MRELLPGTFQDFNFDMLKSRSFGKMSNMSAAISPFWVRGKVSQQGASVSELPAALRRPQKNTPLDFETWILLDFVIFDRFQALWMFFQIWPI